MTRLDPTIRAALDPASKWFTRERMLSFTVTVSLGSVSEAASEVNKTPTGVRDDIRELTRRCGNHDLYTREHDESGAYLLTAIGQQLYDHCKQALAAMASASRIGKIHAPVISHLPHHAQFVAPAVKHLGGMAVYEPNMLDERHRSVNDFEKNVIQPLEDGSPEIHVAVGPPAANRDGRPKLRDYLLYTARLEALLDVDHPDEYIELGEVISHVLLLPPPGFRSRQMFDERVRALLNTGVPSGRKVHTSYTAAALTDYCVAGLGTAVLPSDVGTLMRNRQPQPFDIRAVRWVPIRHDGQELTHPVYATVRAAEQDELRPLIEKLAEEVSIRPTLGVVNPWTA